ncbi:MAG: YegP family protein [Dehalococcoidales bacterium]|nr:YegP family protein [Dehalococcoidales bacterium]
MAAKFELYTDAKGEYRWRLVASNGQAIASGGEGYTNKAGAINGIESVKKNAPDAPIVEK